MDKGFIRKRQALSVLIVICIIFLFSVVYQFSDNTIPNTATQTAKAIIAQSLWETPVLPPEYLRLGNIEDSNSYPCIYISQGYIWEPGDENGETYSKVARSTRLIIDGISIKRGDRMLISEQAILINRTDENGNYLGSHGGEIAICFDIKALSLKSGLHLAELSFQGRSGKEYNYRWAFRLNFIIDQQITMDYPFMD